MFWKVEFRNSVPLSLCTMLHVCSVKIFRKTSVTSRADFLRTGIAQTRLVKTSIHVSKYLIPSLNDDRFERSTRSIWNRLLMPFEYVFRRGKRNLFVLCKVYASWPSRNFFTSRSDRPLYRCKLWPLPKLPGKRNVCRSNSYQYGDHFGRFRRLRCCRGGDGGGET